MMITSLIIWIIIWSIICAIISAIISAIIWPIISPIVDKQIISFGSAQIISFANAIIHTSSSPIQFHFNLFFSIFFSLSPLPPPPPLLPPLPCHLLPSLLVCMHWIYFLKILSNLWTASNPRNGLQPAESLQWVACSPPPPLLILLYHPIFIFSFNTVSERIEARAWKPTTFTTGARLLHRNQSAQRVLPLRMLLHFL